MKPLVLLLALASLPATAAAQRRFRVTIDSVPQGAAIYLEDREAGSQGNTPHTFQLAAGSYTFILELQGHEPLTRSVVVKKNATFTFTLTRKPSPASLSLSSAGPDAQGATVKVNGKDTGKIPVTLALQPGRYLVEVSKEGFETWREWVDAQAAEKRHVVVSLVRAASGLGSLLVSSNIMGAEVFVDGKRVDTAPALLEKLTPGKRTVEVRAPGYLIRQQEVDVEAGKTTKVTIELQLDPKAAAAASGTLQVLANHKGVEVVVDGQARGLAPLKVEGLAEGTHVVEGRKQGFTSVEQTVAVKKGELTTVKLSLKEVVPVPRSGGLRVISPALGATVFIDGQLAGKTPLLRHQLDPGPHFVTVRAPGYEEYVQAVEVRAGQIVEVKAVLARSSALPSEAVGARPVAAPAASPSRRAADPRGLSSFGAPLVNPGNFTADLSLGFAHLVEGRLTAGFFSVGHLGMDGGVEFRTYGQVSEIGVHTKLRLLQKSIFSLGALFSVGGGGGPSGRNTVYANLGVVSTLWFKRLVAFTARAYFNFYSDRLCPGTPEPDELTACALPPPGITAAAVRDRVAGTRFLLSAILEVPVTRHFGLFGLFEGAPGQGNRLSYSDPFASYMPDSDPGVYGRVGASFKY